MIALNRLTPFSPFICSMYYDVSMSGIYIHIPFCIKKCSYCDFYSVPYTRQLAEKYVDSLIREIEIFSHHAVSGTFEGCSTLYIGGGTPSCLGPDLFNPIIESVHDKLEISALTEFTVEVNPGTLSAEKLQAYGDAGVNRISIGAQSFNDRYLQKLGRIHRKNDIYGAFEQVREAGFSNINIDLIFGIPLQREEEVILDAIEATNLSPAHISAYALSIEEGTPLFEEVKAGLETPSDDDYAECYRILDGLMEKRGYHHYEISNFAKRNFECSHNIGYWTGKEYIAFGAGASGHLKVGRSPGGFRYTNHANLGDYIKAIKRGQLPRAETIQNDAPTAWKERLIMGLRLTGGICIATIQEELGEPPRSLRKSIHQLLKANLLQKDDDMLKIPQDLIFTSNEVLARLV